jgi:hypothetical protein
MPVYSLSRTTQYTTVAQITSKTNQGNNYSWNGFYLAGYGSTFNVTYTTVCPTANRTWNYATPSSPTAAYVWYPYSMTMALSGGEPQSGLGDRVGLAYMKLYSSTGAYIMGSSPTNSLANGGQIWNGAAVQATSFAFTNSRNTLTLTANTTYVAGFSSPSSGTFWNIFARETAQTGQDVYYDSTSVNPTGGMTISATPYTATNSIMGFITYNACPPQPTNLVITSTSTGISVTCQSNEAQSFISGVTASAVVNVRFFYSETLGGTYNYLGADTVITRTLISGTTYQYVATFEGGTTLTQGKQYYFKVATMNDVCIQYQAENVGSIPASQQSTAVFAQYGNANVVRVRNSGNNGWTTIDVKVRNINNTWTSANVAVRNVNDDAWLYN